ncbi:hypothetical protein PR048_010089 [Dryococelus australis]|uniref:Uncharacterized protein n=1 Tax=Dryococelus australis TaxID=614101 RepID=A0ABQ9I1Q8_9NEOP|nr:hypothetical protein PR048_010089 [Dryococelus australis]
MVFVADPRRPTGIEEFIVLPSDEFDSVGDSWFGRIPQWFNIFNFNTAIRDFMASMNPFGDIDELINKGNTTSETQVVNGTVITRNVTTYVDKDSGTVVHVSSVDIRQSEKTPGDVEEVTSPAGKDPESTEAIDINPSVDNADIDTPAKESNEIPNDKKLVEEPIAQSSRPMDNYDKRNYYHYPNVNDIDNDIEVFGGNEAGGLQNDLYVNTVLEEKIRQSGGMHQLDPDVELIDVSGGKVAETYPNTQIQSKNWYFPEELQS